MIGSTEDGKAAKHPHPPELAFLAILATLQEKIKDLQMRHKKAWRKNFMLFMTIKIILPVRYFLRTLVHWRENERQLTAPTSGLALNQEHLKRGSGACRTCAAGVSIMQWLTSSPIATVSQHSTIRKPR